MNPALIYFDPGVFLLFPVLLLLIPLKWILAFLLAAAIHELAHILCVLLLDGTVREIRVGFHGAVIEAAIPHPFAEFVSILAGPASSCLLSLFMEVFPELGICGLVQGVYNFLPVFPFDGGRLIYGILCRFIPDRAEIIMGNVQKGIVFILIFLCFTALFLENLYLLAAISLILFSLIRKSPCKPA